MALCNTKLGFPIFDMKVLNTKEFIIAGGGGASKSGVLNKICVCELGPRPDGIRGVSAIEKFTLDTENRLAAFVSGSGKLIASSYDDGKVCVHDVGNEMKMVYQCSGGSGPVCLFPRNGNPTLATSSGSNVQVYTLGSNNKEEEVIILPHLGPIIELVLDAKGEFLLTCSEDDCVRIWDLKSNLKSYLSILPSEVNNGFALRRARFDENFSFTKRIYVLQVPKNRRGSSFVVCWEFNSQEQVWMIQNVSKCSDVLATTMTVNESYVVVGTADCQVVFFEKKTLRRVYTSVKIHGLPITGIITYNNSHVVTCSPDQTLAMVEFPKFSLFSPVFSLIKWMLVLFLCVILPFVVAVLTLHCRFPLEGFYTSLDLLPFDFLLIELAKPGNPCRNYLQYYDKRFENIDNIVMS